MGLPKIGLEAVLDDRNFRRGLDAYLRGIDQMQRETSSVASGIGGQFLSLGNGVLKAAGLVAGAVVGIASAGATALGVIGKDAMQTATSVESAFAGVVKTTDGLTSSVGVLNETGKELKEGFKDLAEQVPVSVEELMRIGELGGQLGVGKDALLDFTRTIADISVATDLTTEEASMGFSQFMNVMGTAQGEVDRVGSAIVALGNNFATTESRVLDFAQRIAGAGKIAGLTESDVLGIAAAFSSVGVEAEAGGTATQKALFTINQSVFEGNENLDIIARTAGVSSKAFQTAWRDDAGGAFALFVQGLGRQGDQAMGTLAALGLEDQRLVRGFLSLANAGDLVTRSIELSSDAWRENTALAAEAAQRYATTESKMQLARNQMRNIKDDIGSALLPAWRGLLDLFSELAERYGPVIVDFFQNQIAPALQAVGDALRLLLEGDVRGALSELAPAETVDQIMNVAAAIQEFIGQAAAFVGEHAEAFKTALMVIGGALATAGIAAGVLQIAGAIGTLLNPIGLVAAAVGGLAAAWTANLGGIQEKTQAVIDWIMPYVNTALDFLQGLWATHGDTVIGAVQTAWQSIQTGFQAGTDFVQNLIETVLRAVQTFWEAHGEQVMEIVTPLFENIKTTVQTVMAVVQNIIGAVQAAIKGDWSTFGAELRDVVDAIWEGIKKIFANSAKALVKSVDLLIDLIVKAWQGIDWAAVGQAVIDGIAAGIKAGVGAIKNAARSAAQAALDAAKAFLGISSPSAVTAEMIGQPFVWGIGDGIQEAIRQLERVTLPEVTARLVSGFDLPTVRPPAGAALAGATMMSVGGARTYELHIHTTAPTENVVADFHMLEALT